MTAPPTPAPEEARARLTTDERETARTLYRRIGNVLSLLRRNSKPNDDERAQIRMLTEWETIVLGLGWPEHAALAATKEGREPAAEGERARLLKLVSHLEFVLAPEPPRLNDLGDIAPSKARRDWWREGFAEGARLGSKLLAAALSQPAACGVAADRQEEPKP